MSDERNVPGRGPYLVVMSGLAGYAAFETIAIAFAWLASRQWTEVVAKMMFVNQNLERTVLSDQAERKYDDLVGIFDALLAIGEVGLVVAFSSSSRD